MNDEPTTNDDDSYKNKSLIANYSYQQIMISILAGSLRYSDSFQLRMSQNRCK